MENQTLVLNRLFRRAPGGGNKRLGPDAEILPVKTVHFLSQGLVGLGSQILLPRPGGGFGQHLAQLDGTVFTRQARFQALQQGQGLGVLARLEQASGLAQGGGQTQRAVGVQLGGFGVNLGGNSGVPALQGALGPGQVKPTFSNTFIEAGLYS